MEDLEWKGVTSSNVKQVAHDGSHLYVEFRSGVYCYHHVPRDVFDALLESPSAGRFVRSEVIPSYDAERIRA